jgi:ketose-bisphosphate aldolase
MSIVGMDGLLRAALQCGYALGYFEAWDQYSMEAAIEAAEEEKAPAILGFGGAVTSPAWLECRGIEEMAALARCLAQRSALPVAVLFNEARTLAQVELGLKAGCNAVMLDTSLLPFAENQALTRRVVEMAHHYGASVEAELGHLADAGNPASGQGTRTDPDEAARFVVSTGVDALAVSIGNTHLLVDGQATVNLDLLGQLQRAAAVPLVIHGGSGFPAEAVPQAIARGVAKFNIGTRLKHAYLAGIREAIGQIPNRPNIHSFIGSREESDILAAGRERVRAEIRPLLRLYGCAGRAASL